MRCARDVCVCCAVWLVAHLLCEHAATLDTTDVLADKLQAQELDALEGASAKLEPHDA